MRSPKQGFGCCRRAAVFEQYLSGWRGGPRASGSLYPRAVKAMLRPRAAEGAEEVRVRVLATGLITPRYRLG